MDQVFSITQIQDASDLKKCYAGETSLICGKIDKLWSKITPRFLAVTQVGKVTPSKENDHLDLTRLGPRAVTSVLSV